MLVPQVSLTVWDRLYEEQILGLHLRRTRAPGLDRLEVALPLATTFGASPGDACALDLDGGDADGPGRAATVFTGRITGISRRGRALVLTAHDGGLALARFRPVGAYEQMGLDEVIETLCSDAGVDVAVDLDAPTLALYAANGAATAMQEVARLAALGGGAAAFDGEGVLHVTADGGPDTELALRYGRELLDIRIDEDLQPEDAITLMGEGAGAPTAPEARWLATDFLGGSAPQAGIAARRKAAPELRDSADTEAAGAALAAARSAAARPIWLKSWLLPQLAPGMRLEIADLPDPLSLEDCRITQVVSRLEPGGAAETRVWARGRPSEGGLLGLIGGLL